MRIIRAKEVTEKSWSGGKTSQLFIYPETYEYSQLNFIYRLSKATIEETTSVFTSLPGVKRELMVTEGTLVLSHESKYNKKLQPYETDRFLGDWQTNSAGKGSDFNLMMMGKTEGYLQQINANRSEEINIDSACNHVIIHCLTGKVCIDKIELQVHDTGVISNPSSETKIKFVDDSTIIITRIWLND